MSTLAELENTVAVEIGLDNSPDGDQPMIAKWLNDAVVDLLLRTQMFVSTTTIPLTANQGDYELSTDILSIQDIYLASQGANFRVKRLATTDLVNLRVFGVASSPMQYYAVSGANLLMVYPTPLLNDVLTIYYVPRPTPMSEPDDDPADDTLGGIPTEYHVGLELYAMWKAGSAFDDGSSGNGVAYQRLYEGDPTAPPGTEQRFGLVGRIKRDMRDKGGKHLAAIVLPPRGRRIYVPLPGIDVGPLIVG